MSFASLVLAPGHRAATAESRRKATRKIWSVMTEQQSSSRVYFIDWLRIFAVLMLVPFHTGMIFVPWDFHIKNAELSGPLTDFNSFIHIWHMPLLFFLSGAGTWFALGFRSARQYVVERTRRLFIPLVFGTFVIVPPQTYYLSFRRGDGYFSSRSERYAKSCIRVSAISDSFPPTICRLFGQD